MFTIALERISFP